MNFRGLIRFFLVFGVTFAGGLTLLLTLAGGEDREPRRGLEIRDEPSPASVARRPELEGLPALLSAEEPQYTAFEEVVLDPAEGGPPVSVKYVAWTLTCERLEMTTETAVGVALRMFPAPVAPPAADDEPPVAVVEIHAGQARGEERLRGPAESDESQWVLLLGDGVKVISREEGRSARLDAEDIEAYTKDQRVISRGAVEIRADEYVIRGVGLDGDAALGTFRIDRDVEVSIPTAALAGERLGEKAEPATTVIRSPGPLLVERLTEETDSGVVPTRVTFMNGVTVEQVGTEGKQAELTAEEFTLDLLIRPDAPEAERVTVSEVRADGRVHLQGRKSDLRAESLNLLEDAEGFRIDLGGPVEARYEGALPGAPGEENATDDVLTVHAEEKAFLRRKPETGRTVAEFTGGVTTRRVKPDGTLLLQLKSEKLHLESDAEKGETMRAEGDANFLSPMVKGRGEELVWERVSEGHDKIVLRGDPRVKGRSGGGDRFQLFGGKPKHKGRQLGLELSCQGDLTVDITPERAELHMADRAVIARLEDLVEVIRVEAAECRATMVGEDLSTVVATGGVTARGKGHGGLKGRYTASGDEFRYRFLPDDPIKELAVLTGSPAEARLIEAEDRVSHIKAPRFRFILDDERFIGEEGVKAVVFIRGPKDEATHPFTVKCGTLNILPGSGGDELPDMIRTLEATGGVELAGSVESAAGDELTYGIEEPTALVLRGAPARIERRNLLRGGRYLDYFRSSQMRLTISGEEIRSFLCPTGGEFTLHRLYQGGGLEMLGPSDGAGEEKEEKRTGLVERLSGACSGELSYDTRTARMSNGAWVEQGIGGGETFRRVARFEASVIEALLGPGAEGKSELKGVTGKGSVRAVAEGWSAECGSFELDFGKHRTTVIGSPARVTQNGKTILFSRWVYDYVKDRVEEAFRAELER